MALPKFLIFVTLLGFSVAGPLIQSGPTVEETKENCDSECPDSEAQNLGFKAGSAYVYSYSGTSRVTQHGVAGSKEESSLRWEAEVLMNWISPCQVAIEIKKPVINGVSENEIISQLLTQKPMVAIIKDGVVTGVCADMDDHPTSLNLKKGVISSIQNVLPEISKSIVNKTFVEVDIMGRCPTIYSVEENESNMVVYKEKNHKDCFNQELNPEDSPLTSWWLKVPIKPLNVSRSICTQIISKREKIIEEVHCRDVKKVTHMLLAQTSTIQESKLKLVKVLEGISITPIKVRQTNLTFEVVPQPMSEEIVPEVKHLLKELCTSTETHLKKETAFQLSKLIGYLNRVPAKTMKQMLSGIRTGEYCQKHNKLESIFLDSIVMVSNPGAVEIMVEEVTTGKINGGRTPMYALALHLTLKPCLQTVQAVSPLFDSENVPSYMVLAAGSLVRRRCKYSPKCIEEAPVREILEKLSRKIDSSCQSTSTNQKKKAEVLTMLKSIGNIAKVTKSLERSIVKCVESEEADVYVRVAAAQTFRQTPCNCQPTTELIERALDSNEQTEVRIATYVAAIKCASYEQSRKIVSKISSEANTQVRSFILSHLRNLQTSDAPYLKELRYNLTSFIIPMDYEKDFRKYSRSMDHSYYMPTLGIGAGIDTSVIYAPGSYIPRQIQTNLTTNLFDNVINIAEFAIRSEEIESLIDSVLESEYIRKTHHFQIAKDMMIQLISQGTKAHKTLKKHVNNPAARGDWTKAASNIIDMIQSHSSDSKSPSIDAFLRIFGKEIVFTTLKPELQKANLDSIFDKILEMIGEALFHASDMRMNAARAAQVNFEYFVPTVQGIPLQMKIAATGVASLEVENSITMQKSIVKVLPCISMYTNVFIGYSVGAKSGLRNKVHALLKPHNDFRVELKDHKLEVVMDMPQKVRAVDFNSTTYMITKLPGQEDQKVSKSSSEIKKQSCSPRMRAFTGLEVCWELKVPDYTKELVFPFGETKIVVDFEKKRPHKELLKLTGKLRSEEQVKEIELSLEAPGSETPKKGEVSLEYEKSSDVRSVKVYGMGPSGGKKAVQVHVKTRTTSHGAMMNVIGYIGKEKSISTADEVLLLNIRGGYSKDEMETQFDLKTKGILAKYVDTDINVDVASKKGRYSFIPRRPDIRKLDVMVDVPKVIRTETYVRPVASSSGSEYKIYSLTKTPSRTLLKIEGNSTSKGEMQRSTYDSRLKLSIETPVSHMNSEFAFVWTEQKKQWLVSLKRQGAQKHCVLLNATMAKSSPSSLSYVTTAEVEIPLLIADYKMEGSVNKSSRGYVMKMVSKKDDKPLYMIQGPVDLDVTAKGIRQNSNFRIKIMSSNQEFQLKTKLSLTPEKKDAMIDLKKNGAPIISTEGEIVMEGDSVTSTLELAIPNAIDARFKAEKSNSVIQVALNGYLMPNTKESTKIIGKSIINYSEKKLMAAMDYDLDKNPQKMRLNTVYNYDSDMKMLSLRGNVESMKGNYKYNVMTALGIYSQDPRNKNELSIRVTKPDGQEFILETSCLVRRDSQKQSTVLRGTLQCSPEKFYEISSDFEYDFRQAPSIMFIKGQVQMETPSLKRVTIVVDSNVDLKEKSQMATCKVEMSGPMLQVPLKCDGSYTNQADSLIANVDMNLGALSNISIKGNAKVMKQSQSIGDASLELNIKASSLKLYSLKADKSERQSGASVSVDRKKVLALDVFAPQSEMWVVKLTTPSRVTEAHSRRTENELSFAVYPNRRHSEDKYEVNGHYHISNARIDTGANIKYPRHERVVTLQAIIDSGEKSSKGKIELDIFKNPQDKVVIQVLLEKRLERNYRVEADMTIPNKDISPRMVAEIASSPEVKRLELVIKKSPSSKPLIETKLSYNKISQRNGNLYARLVTPTDHLEIISNLQLHELFQCRGASANGTFVSERHGSYDFASAVCAPGYIELGAKKSVDDKIYFIKLGMKNPTSIKVALDLVYNSTNAITAESVKRMETTLNLYGRHEYLPKIPMILVGAKLWAPTVVSLDVYYNKTGIMEYMDYSFKPFIRGIKEVSKEIERTLPDITKELPILVEEVQKLKDSVYEEIVETLENIGLNLPSIKKIRGHIDDIISEISKLADRIMKDTEEALEKTIGISLHEIRRILKTIDDNVEVLVRYIVKESSRIIKTIKEGKEAMMKVPTLKWLIETVESSSIWDWFKQTWEQFKEMFSEEIHTIQKAFEHYINLLKHEVDYIYKLITNNPFIKKIIKWIESWFHTNDDNDDLTIIGALVTKFYGFYLTEKTGLIRVQVPLRRPVSSLSAAAPSVGIALPSARKLRRQYHEPSSILQEFIHPYTKHATIEGLTLTTFDGLVIPMISSKCELLLVKVNGDRVTVVKKNVDETDIKISLKTGKEFHMYLTLGRLPSVPILGAARELKIPGAEIEKVGKNRIVIKLEELTVKAHLASLEIEAKPDIFNKIEGLMGNHDSEKANDAPKAAEIKYYPRESEGKHHLTTPSARELLEKYRIDQTCQIPTVN